jgi:hypothetical protein
MKTLRVLIKLICISFFFLQVNFVSSQSTSYIQAKLINAEKKTPVPFATIRLKNVAKGLTSNADGGFIIPSDLQKVGDTLVISSIGYLSKEVVISELSRTKVNIIYLTESLESLDEVVIVSSKRKRKLNAKTIVRYAMRSIPENYPFAPFCYVGYYRDYQIKDQQYLNLNEAILEVFDPGFDQQDLLNTQTQIFQYKQNTDFPTDTLASKPYDYDNRSKMIKNATINGLGGNEYTLLRLHDAIRNYSINTYDFVNRLDVDLVKNHRFKLVKETSIDEIPLYDIRISKNTKNFIVAGEIYISKGDYKIYKLQYAVYDKRASSRHEKHLPTSSYQSVKKERKLGKLIYEIIVEYQPYQDIMYPKYISFNNAFDILQPPKFVPVQTKANVEKKRFEMTFNNTPQRKDAVRKKNYKVTYQDVKLKIDSITLNDQTVLLYPENPDFVFDAERIQILRKSTKNKGVAIEVKNVRDVDGNVVYEQESEAYNQFREFFVQQLLFNAKKPSDSLWMIKNRPIFDRQPISAPKNLSEYWMNTPLKN